MNKLAKTRVKALAVTVQWQLEDLMLSTLEWFPESSIQHKRIEKIVEEFSKVLSAIEKK
jgi:hypothetical protein